MLVEVVAALKERNLFPNPKFSIFIDGGVRRASDVLKAIALGATAGEYAAELVVAWRSYLSINSGCGSPILVRLFSVWAGWFVQYFLTFFIC